MKATVEINGQDVKITLTPEQVAQITAVSKPKLFKYEHDNTWFIGSEAIDRGFSGSAISSLRYGRYRRTKQQAEMDFKRQTRMMRLAALAWEVGECVDFVQDGNNYWLSRYQQDGKWEIGSSEAFYAPETVYMTRETAHKVCDMLNSGKYSLEV